MRRSVPSRWSGFTNVSKRVMSVSGSRCCCVPIWMAARASSRDTTTAATSTSGSPRSKSRVSSSSDWGRMRVAG
eukprot:7011272-Alexandrium_andersonii.AAC.1